MSDRLSESDIRQLTQEQTAWLALKDSPAWRLYLVPAMLSAAVDQNENMVGILDGSKPSVDANDKRCFSLGKIAAFRQIEELPETMIATIQSVLDIDFAQQQTNEQRED